MFGLMALFAAAATVHMDPLIQYPGCFTANILNHMESTGSNPDITINIFYPLTVLHSKTNNDVFTLKEETSQTGKLYFVSAMEK